MDASLCPKLLSESILDEEEVVKVSGRVNDQETGLKIAEVVTALGPLLTHKEVPKRQLGCQFLSQCLVKIREDHLDLAEIHLLATFLIDRLQDSPLMLSPALQGFSALSGMKQLGDEDLHAIVRALLFELHCQSLTVKDRSRILDLLHFSLTGPRLRPLLDGPLAGQFVHGFLQCVEGETNPRNLNVIFGCWPIILEHFDCGIFLEDIFEVLSCYFPIDFSQPKNNPYSVTKEDLTRGLEASLEASDKFAPYAIPLFMEKLSSDLVEAKIDSLSCFRSCLRKYSPAQLAPSLKDVWNSCKQEIMGIRANSDKKVIEMTYKLLEVSFYGF